MYNRSLPNPNGQRYETLDEKYRDAYNDNEAFFHEFKQTQECTVKLRVLVEGSN